MGLTIHTTLRLARDVPDSTAHAMVSAAHVAATRLVRRRKLGEIGPVVPAAGMPMIARWVLVKLDAHTTTGIEVPPLAGWCFAVDVGEGCEPAIFGLCRYPATVRDHAGRTRRTGLARGWSFAHACKTQYAGLHGWTHFLQCHRAVIDLAQLWTPGGIDVVVEDEGHYWPGRDTRALRAQLATYDRAIAGLAGMLKDAADEKPGPPVRAPILAHPEFERLEAEGVTQHASALASARRILTTHPHRPNRPDAHGP